MLAAGVVGCAGQAPLPDVAVPAPIATPPAARFPMPRAPFAEPADDPFHAQPSATELGLVPPGRVMRYRPVQAQSYYLFDVDARAWQLLYRSSDTHGQPQANVATVLVPPDPEPKLLSYQVAYDALTRRCAPSRTILSGALLEQMLVSKALRRGWVVVLPDYEGPQAQFAAGINAGRGVLDGIRAAQRFLPDNLIGRHTPTVLWGYSGGAHASLFAAELAADYAPDINIAGIAAGGPPTNLADTAVHLDGGMFAGIYFAAMIGLSRAYDEIDTDALLNDAGREMFADLDASCVGQELAWVRDPLLSGYSFDDITDYTTVDELLAVPAIQRIIAENSLGQQGFDAPLFYYQAFFDQLTPRARARDLARRYCDHGVPVRFDYALGEHFTAAFTQASSAVDYLARRFDNQPAADECAELQTE